jgi:hypothetical protein
LSDVCQIAWLAWGHAAGERGNRPTGGEDAVAISVQWADLVADEDLARLLGAQPACPRCGLALVRDRLWSRPYFVDDAGHAYSNMRVLIEELRERGWLPGLPLDERTGGDAA